MEEKELHITILNEQGDVVEHYSGAISDPRMSYHYTEYLMRMERIDMGGNEGIHKSKKSYE